MRARNSYFVIDTLFCRAYTSDMAETPEVPDLKKALENKPASFAWTPGSTVAKAAASAAGASGPSRALSARERLMAQGRGKIALIAVILTTGALGVTYAAFQFSGTTTGRSASLAGVSSTMKIPFARQNDPTGLIVREKAESSERMLFDRKGGLAGEADEAHAGKAAGGKGGPGENGSGAAPMNYDDGPASRAGTSGGEGGATGQGEGVQGDADGPAGGFAGGGGSRLGSPFGSVKFQGMKRVSATSGFRSIQGRRGAFTKTTQTGGSSANSAGTAKGGAATGGSAVSGGNGSGASGVQSGRAAGGGAGSAGGGAADSGGGGGGGGGGEGGSEGDVESPQDISAQISGLLKDAKDDRDKAEKEKKLSIAAAALSNHPAAAYHYKRYEKAKESSDKKKEEAQRLTMEMAGAVAP
jgi:hypothetical protein